MRRVGDDIEVDRQRRYWWAQGVSISPRAIIDTDQLSILEIGQGSLIGSYTILNLLSDPLADTPTPSVIRIGERTAINEFNNIRAAGAEISIGNNCLLSQYVAVIGSNHSTRVGIPMRDQPWNMLRRGVTIEDDVWIGTHAVILPGVTLGAGCVIGAGAVVSTDIPENAIAVGVPAQVKKFR